MKQPLFHRIFIANRGEVAVRIAKTCDKLGITPVFGVSEADANAPYLTGREKVILGPSSASKSYLDLARVVQAAKQTQCSALHPGWGFLAENAQFALLLEEHGVTFIGPPAHVIERMGKKTPAKRLMKKAGIKLIPGSDGILRDVQDAEKTAEQIGFPVLIKAESGGGGKGMRIARSLEEVQEAFEDAERQASAAFGDPRVYMERLIEQGRHIEIQIFADRYGNVVHLGERDCTVQRNHQKLIEESPAIALSEEERTRTFNAAIHGAKSIGYVGAGTMEFLMDEKGELRFMEMNTRLQVEHSVTEMRTGLDLVEEQIRVAAGCKLSFKQEDIELKGHAIECRINAEDPEQNFLPSPGVISTWEVNDQSAQIRVDTHVESGYEVPPFYDSLLCKVISFADTRKQACEQMIQTLEQMKCEGVKTTVPMHISVLRSDDFQTNNYNTSTIPGWKNPS